MYLFGNELSGTAQHYATLQCKHKVAEAYMLKKKFKHCGGHMHGILPPDIIIIMNKLSIMGQCDDLFS